MISMKKSIVVMAVAILLTGSIVISCNTPAEKVEKAENKVTEANKDLDAANKQYMDDVQNFRRETSAQMATNDSSIAVLQAKIDIQKNVVKADYKKQIAELEQRNNDMKKRMNDYKSEGKDSWVTFKTTFNHDMDELSKTVKNLTSKNGK